MFLNTLNKPLHVLGSFSDPDELYQFVKREGDTVGKFYCALCHRYSHVKRSNVRDHVESKHFQGSFLYHCDLCPETFSTKVSVQKHRHRKHVMPFAVQPTSFAS